MTPSYRKLPFPRGRRKTFSSELQKLNVSDASDAISSRALCKKYVVATEPIKCIILNAKLMKLNLSFYSLIRHPLDCEPSLDCWCTVATERQVLL